jgi:hypothetical protein
MTDEPDPRAVYEALRISTAEMLGLDLATLSATDGLRLDFTALLRLQVDHLQSVALAGREVDLSKLQACHAMLTKLLPKAVEAPAAVRSPADDARERLAAIYDNIAAAREVAESESDERLLNALEADALSHVLGEQSAAVADDAVDTAAPEVAPPQSPPPPVAPPAHWLADHSREPWRDHVSGNVIAPDRWSNRN